MSAIPILLLLAAPRQDPAPPETAVEQRHEEPETDGPGSEVPA